MKPPVPLPRIAPILALAALLAAGILAGIAAALLPPPPDASAQSSYSACRKETGTAYPGGKGSPHFQGIPNAASYEPVTDTSGRRAVVRDLIEVYNLSTANCSWQVVSKDKEWVTLNTESGTLGPDKHDTIQVSINSRAQSLRPGTYKARIKFQLGPKPDNWNAYAVVILEILDRCFIKVRDADRLDIKDGGLVDDWEGTIGRPPAEPLQHRVIIWNSSNSKCRLSAQTNRRWLEAEFQDATTIGKGDTTALILSANDRWEREPPGTHQAAITIHDAISGAEHSLYIVMETEHPPCQLVVKGAGHLQFDGVARSVRAQDAQIQLENQGGVSCEWRAASKQPWLQVTPSEGDVWGGDIGPVTIGIVSVAANGLKSNADDGEPHSGSVDFSYLVGGIRKPVTVPVALRLSKPPCEMSKHTPKEMLLRYSPGEGVNPARHHLPIEISNAPDSAECRYQIELPNWLVTDAGTGILPEGISREITVKLNANSAEAQAGQEEYDDFITFVLDDAPDLEIPVRLETDCPAGEACGYLHTTHTEIHVGDRAEMTYTVISPANEPVSAKLTLELPDGWQIDGEGFAEKCSGVCTATYDVSASDQRHIGMIAYPNQAGQFDLKGRAEYSRMENGQRVPYGGSQETIAINVLPREGAAVSPPADSTPVAPTPTTTPEPTAAPAPTTTPDAGADTTALAASADTGTGGDTTALATSADDATSTLSSASPPAVVPPTSGSFTNILLIVVIAAVAVLALGVVALFILVLRRGGTPAPPQVPPQARPQQPRPTPIRPGGPGNQRR